MTQNLSTPSHAAAGTDDLELARRIAEGDPAALERLMRACNRKLFRVARSILDDDAEAEDALQEAYVTAYVEMKTFRGGSKLTTWVTRIVINEALGRLRKKKRRAAVFVLSPDSVEPAAREHTHMDEPSPSPENAATASSRRFSNALPAHRRRNERNLSQCGDGKWIPASSRSRGSGMTSFPRRGNPFDAAAPPQPGTLRFIANQ